MKLFDYIRNWRKEDPTITWEELAIALNMVPNGTIEDLRTFASGEILRSWYKRQKKKHQELKNYSALGSQNSDPKMPQNSENGAEGSQDMGIIAEGRRMALSDFTKETKNCPSSRPNPFTKPLHIPAKASLVIGDLHAPYHDHAWLTKVIEAAQHELYEIEQIIIGGDVFNFDVVSRHSKAQFVERLETELAYGGELLLWLASIAPLYITNGNHDERIAVKLDAGLSLRRVIAMALDGKVPDNTITVTDYDYLFVGDRYIVGHLERSASIPGKAAHSIIQKYHRHVLTFHEHSRGVYTGTNSPQSPYIGASVGCSTSTETHWYASRRLNSQKPFAKGFAIIADDTTFSLYDDNAEEYFARYAIRNGYYNCFKV